jgi:hypothetical protein
MLPDNVVQEVRNMIFDEGGGLPKKRSGSQKMNSTAVSTSYPIRGMVVNHRTDGTVYVYVVTNGKIYYSDDFRTFTALQGAFSSTEDVTVSNALDFEGIVWNNKVIFIANAYPVITNTPGGDFENAAKTVAILIDGTTVKAIIDDNSVKGSTDAAEVLVTDFPQRNKYIIRQYGDRLVNRIFLAGTNANPDLVTWSNAITSDLSDGDLTPTYGSNSTYVGKEDGEDIRGMAGYQGNIYIFKPHNVYRITAFGDKETWEVARIPTTHGALWHRTIKEWMGLLVWMSWDGVYATDGNTVMELSEPIKDEFDSLPQVVDTSRYWLQTTNADWDAGSKTNTSADPESWEDYELTDIALALTTEAVEDSETGGGADSFIGAPFKKYSRASKFAVSPDDVWCTKLTVDVRKVGSPSVDLNVAIAVDSNGEPGSIVDGSVTSIARGDISSTFATETVTYSTPVELSESKDYWVILYATTDSANDYYSWVYGAFAGGGSAYSDGAWTVTANTAHDFAVYEQHYPTSGTNTFVSQTKDLGNGVSPSAWGLFEVTDDLNSNGTITYHLDTSVNNSDWDGYVQVYNGLVPNVRTDRRYFRFKITFSTSDGNTTPVTSDVRVNWFLGSATTTPCALSHKNRYYLNIQSETGDFNDTVYMIDKFRNWTMFDGIRSNIFDFHNDVPIGGGSGVSGTAASGDNGYVIIHDSGSQDKGSDFTAYFVTKTLDFFDQRAVYRRVWLKHKGGSTWNFYVNIDDAKSGTADDWGTANEISANAEMITDDNLTLSGLNQGKRIKFKVEVDEEDTDFQFGGLDLGFIRKSMRR